MAFENYRSIADIMLANTGRHPSALSQLASGWERGTQLANRKRLIADQERRTGIEERQLAEAQAKERLGMIGAEIEAAQDPGSVMGLWAEVNDIRQNVFGQPALKPTNDELARFQVRSRAWRGEKASERKIVKDVNGVNRYVDTGEQVFGGVQKTEDPNDIKAANLKTEEGLRKELNSLNKDFYLVSGAYERVKASAQDPSAAGDLALIFNFMKMQDPGSTVREGEFATAQNAAGVDQRIMALYNNILKGQRMAPEQRFDFVDRSNRLYSAARDEASKTARAYTTIAQNAGVNVENVLANYNVRNNAAPIPLNDDERTELEMYRKLEAQQNGR